MAVAVPLAAVAWRAPLGRRGQASLLPVRPVRAPPPARRHTDLSRYHRHTGWQSDPGPRQRPQRQPGRHCTVHDRRTEHITPARRQTAAPTHPVLKTAAAAAHGNEQRQTASVIHSVSRTKTARQSPLAGQHKHTQTQGPAVCQARSAHRFPSPSPPPPPPPPLLPLSMQSYAAQVIMAAALVAPSRRAALHSGHI